MASAHPLASDNACNCSPLVLGLDGHESGPLRGYNLLLELTLLGLRTSDKYEEGCTTFRVYGSNYGHVTSIYKNSLGRSEAVSLS